MLRGILILFSFGVGGVLSLQGIAFASSLFIWNDIFRPIAFTRWWAEFFPAAYYVTFMLLVSIFVRRWHRRWNPAATTMLILCLWMMVCTFTSVHRSVAMETTIRQLTYMIPLILISISLVTRFGQNLFVWTLAASVGVWGIQAGYYCLMTGQPSIAMSIPGGQMSDRNDFIVGVNASLPLIAYTGWFYTWRFRSIVRPIAKFGFFASIAAVFFSLSRGGILGIAALSLFYMLATGRLGKRAALGAVAVMMLLALMPGFVAERMDTIELDTEYQSDGSAASRLNLVKVGSKMAMSNPIVGVGPGNFPYLAMTYDHWYPAEPHNIWLKAAAEYGFPMLTLFALTLLMILRNLGRERKRARLEGDRETEMLATALSCAIIGFCATATFTSVFVSEYLWAIIGVAGAFIARQRAMRNNPKVIELERKIAGEPQAAAPVA